MDGSYCYSLPRGKAKLFIWCEINVVDTILAFLLTKLRNLWLGANEMRTSALETSHAAIKPLTRVPVSVLILYYCSRLKPLSD